VSEPIEERAGRLLRRLIIERGSSSAEVADTLGVARAELDTLLSGRGRLDLARLERVLALLGEPPAGFFERLYAAPPGGRAGSPPPPSAATQPPSAITPADPAPSADPSPAADASIPRQEVEGLLRDLKSMIDGTLRMLDAEDAADLARREPPAD
jgi:hypothetical protein